MTGTGKQQMPKKKGSTGKGVLYELLMLAIKIAAIIGALVAIFTFIFGIFKTSDLSMYPAIRDGDLVMYYRFDKKYVASDSVVVQYEGEKQVRRVVAVAGDTVDFTTTGRLIINGSPQQEDSIYELTNRYDTGVEFPMTIPDGEIFVLGDGREHSTDSRVYGAVPTKKTLGKVTMIIRTRRP